MPSRKEDLLKPLAVSPKATQQMLDCGHSKLYELLATGELDSYLDANGRARKITMASIESYIAGQVAATNQVRMKSNVDRGRTKAPEVKPTLTKPFAR